MSQPNSSSRIDFKINSEFRSRHETTVQDLEVAFNSPSSDKVDLSNDSDRYLETGTIPLLRDESKTEILLLSDIVNRALKSSVLMISAHYGEPFQIDEVGLEDLIDHVENCLVWQCVLLEVHRLSDLQVAVLFSRNLQDLKPVWDKSVDELGLPCTLPNLGSFSLISTVDLDESRSSFATTIQPDVSVSFDLAYQGFSLGSFGKFEIDIDTLRTILKDYIHEVILGLLFVKPNQG